MINWTSWKVFILTMKVWRAIFIFNYKTFAFRLCFLEIHNNGGKIGLNLLFQTQISLFYGLWIKVHRADWRSCDLTLMVNQNFKFCDVITCEQRSFGAFLSFYWRVCFSQAALWWDWPTGNWSEWASCRKLSGSTSCNRFSSCGCGRKSEPSSFSRKVENSAFPLSNEHGVFSHRLQTSSLSEQLRGGGIIHSAHPDKYSNHLHCCMYVCHR